MTIGQLPVIYIRHLMDADSRMFAKWLDKGLAVLHYEEELAEDKKMSTDPKDFCKSGKNVMERLWRYCKSGALVVADYNDYGFKNILIGVLPPNSVIKPIKEKCKKSKDYPKGLAYYRMVELKDSIRLNHSDSWTRPLLVLQPRQNNVVHWTIGNIDAYIKIFTKPFCLIQLFRLT